MLKTKQYERNKMDFIKKNCVKVKNIDFEMTKQEVEKLASDYGEIQYIDMDMKNSKINKGYCKVYFSNKNSAVQFNSFINGLKYQDRKLSGQLI